MRHRFLASVPTALLVIAIGGSGVLSGCSSEPGTPNDDASTGAEATPTESPTTPASDDPGTDPNSPFVVAASAVATRSIDQVTQLHVMGVATTGQSGDFPTEQIPMLAKAITSTMTELIATATMLTPPPDSPAAELVSSLESYRTLSRELRNWDPDGDPLPPAWFASLGGTDDDWTTALKALGKLSGEDLLADVPSLPMPESS